MENLPNKFIRRRLPPELLAEIHKCLPLADAINVLVNVPTRAIYQNNSPRMLHTIHRLRMSINDYIDTFGNEDEENDDEEFENYNIIVWKPEFDALLHYGAWLTLNQEFLMDKNGGNRIIGVPKNYVEELILHLANIRPTQMKMMLQLVQMNFEMGKATFPNFLKPLLKMGYRIGSRFLFHSVELKADDGRILHIYDGELIDGADICGFYILNLIVVNNLDRNYWFEIKIILDYLQEFIWRLEFTRWKIKPLNELENVLNWLKLENYLFFEQNGHKLEAKQNIYCDYISNWDLFLRRGANFTQFRHFQIKWPKFFSHNPQTYDYASFLFIYISNTKHPAEFLESIEMNLEFDYFSSLIETISYICLKGTPQGGKQINFDNEKLHILSAKTAKPHISTTPRNYKFHKVTGPILFGDYDLEFTLANIPTNGEYVFDVEVEFGHGLEKFIRMKIQKRKIDYNELESQNEIEPHGKKRKVTNNDEEDEDGPTYSVTK